MTPVRHMPVSAHARVALPAYPIAVFIVLLLGACASPAPPIAELAVADAAVERASTSNTGTDAPNELQIAVAKLASAHRAMADKDMVLARQLAEQAEIDARVAELRAQSARSRRAAVESQQAAGALREEINRETNR